MTGIGSVITKDVPDYTLFYGNPASWELWIDEKGKKIKKIGKDRFQFEDCILFTFDGHNLIKVK